MSIEVAELYLLVEKGESDTPHEEFVQILGAFKSVDAIQEYLDKRGEAVSERLYWQLWKALDTYGLHSEGRIVRRQHVSYTYEVQR